MGDPRKKRKRYETPVHPWQKSAIDAEKILAREYGFKNKKEQWKMQSRLQKYKESVKKLVATRTKQSERERQQLLDKLVKIGLLNSGATFNDVLGLDAKDLMERRLQSLVYRKGLARTVKQARQFITHRHVLVNGKVTTFPSYLVSVDEEPTISFRAKSTLFSETHPERALPKKVEEAPAEEVKKARKKAPKKKAAVKKTAPKEKVEEKVEEPKAPMEEEKKKDKKTEEAPPEKKVEEKTEENEVSKAPAEAVEKPAEEPAAPEKEAKE